MKQTQLTDTENHIAELEDDRREAVYDMMLAQERTAFLEVELAAAQKRIAELEAALRPFASAPCLVR